ncbi:hypothetical protein C2S52_021270 [Perilla frutescens var. hirtella]|nr:hypothetical protein C2S52_021270 [Perilla frutescens var. hirtella]
MKDMAATMKKKFDKYWGECNLLMAIACILDPRCKFHVVNICFPLIYKPTDVCEENIEKVKTSLQMLYDEYVKMAKEEAGTDVSGEGDGGCNPSSSHGSNSSVVTGFDQITSIVPKNEAVSPTKSELQTYLEEGVHIPDGG